MNFLRPSRASATSGGRARGLIAAAVASISLMCVAPASAVTLGGSPSANMNATAELAAGFSDDDAFGCGTGQAVCDGVIYNVTDGQATSIVQYCGTNETHSCTAAISAYDLTFIVDDPANDSFVRTYRACGGKGGCADHSVTWKPWPLRLSASARAVSQPGRVAVTLEASDLPPTGKLRLYDVNHAATVAQIDATSTMGCATAAGPDCRLVTTVGGTCDTNGSGPYFQVQYVLESGAVSKKTGVFRVNGIGSGGHACNNDAGGTGGGTTGTGSDGQGGGDPVPDPPRIQFSGPTSFTLPDESQLVASPSTPTDYPYVLVVRDAETNQIVASCDAKATTSCVVRPPIDPPTRVAVTHHLTSATYLNGDIVKTGPTTDLTVEPYPVGARIKNLGITPFKPGDNSSGGIVQLRIWNAERRPYANYRIFLEVSDPNVKNGRWQPAGGCDESSMDCVLKVDLPTLSRTRETIYKYRSVVKYGDTVLDRSGSESIDVLGGYDVNKYAAAAAAASTCGAIIATHPAPNYPDTDLSIPADLCSRGLVREAIIKLLGAGGAFGATYAAASAGEWLAHQASTSTAQGTTADGGTISGKVLWDELVDRVAGNLRKLNPDVNQLSKAAAQAIAGACLATVASQFALQSSTGLPGGFCDAPSIPMFVVGFNNNEAAAHNFDAIFGNPSKNITGRLAWAVLNYEDGAAKNRVQGRRAWYTLAPFQNTYLPACGGGQTGVPPADACDEYPYYASAQGGKFGSPTPSLRAIDYSQNSSEGALLKSSLYVRCGLRAETPPTSTANGTGGDPYLVLPMPLPDSINPPLSFGPALLSIVPGTFGLCNRGGGGVSDS